MRGGAIMKDYEYYWDEANKDVVPIILGQEAHEENLLLGRILTWLPRKIFEFFKRIIKKSKV